MNKQEHPRPLQVLKPCNIYLSIQASYVFCSFLELSLSNAQALVAAVEVKLKDLSDKFAAAAEEKAAVEAQAAAGKLINDTQYFTTK